jgi:hypothetical protein
LDATTWWENNLDFKNKIVWLWVLRLFLVQNCSQLPSRNLSDDFN